ncbi:MAG TPA: patatin-like phospholipase family protein [Alphaproteobacteria bacterium]|jgi:NTE family protein|nr:patatin-like phospholipase family protein [Alphaproteobacteria bacterium]
MATAEPAPSRPTTPRIGLALGSGAARGWAHIGVLRALARAGIKPDVVAGTSMGALVGGVELAGHLDTLADWALQLTRKRILGYLDLKIGAGGLIGGQQLVRLLAERLGERRIEDLPMRFTAVVTDLVDGHEMWLGRGSLVEAIRAAIALPGLFTPVSIGGRWYVDGALVNPVPVSVCRALGAQLVIAVNLNSDMVGRTRIPGTPLARAIGFDPIEELGRDHVSLLGTVWHHFFHREPNTPSLFGVMANSFNIIQDRITRSRLAGDPPDVMIGPKVGHVGLLEFDRAAEVIAEGERAAERALPEIHEAMAILGH